MMVRILTTFPEAAQIRAPSGAFHAAIGQHVARWRSFSLLPRRSPTSLSADPLGETPQFAGAACTNWLSHKDDRQLYCPTK